MSDSTSRVVDLRMEYADYNGESLHAEIYVTLPFIPFVGLTLQLPDTVFTVQRVNYDLELDLLVCHWQLVGIGLRLKFDTLGRELEKSGWSVRRSVKGSE